MNLTIGIAPAPGSPELLGEICDRIDDIVTKAPRRWRELHGLDMAAPWERQHVIERRESFLSAFARVMKVLTIRHDVDSARVGVPRTDGTVSGPGQLLVDDEGREYGIAVDAGVSITQLRRVLAEAKDAGYLRGPRKDRDGKWIKGPNGRAYQHVEAYEDETTGETLFHAYRAVYVLTPLFFERLGRDIVRKRERERVRRANHRRQRAQRLYPGPLLAGRKLAKGMAEGSRETRRQDAPGAPTRAVSTSGGPPPGLSVDASENEARLAGAIALGLRNKHPDWPDSQVRAEALRLARSGRLS